MTDPKQPKSVTPVEPHPKSGHRTPVEIARDEAGPVQPAPDQAPIAAVEPPKKPSKEDEHIREAVQRSADSARKRSGVAPPDDADVPGAMAKRPNKHPSKNQSK